VKTIPVIQAKGILAQMRGLIGYPKAIPMLFKTRFGIHTFGMGFPIDVIVLDKNKTIVAVKPSLKPNHIYLWNPKYPQIIELPENSINKMELHIGESISINKI
jgi:uncharacterized protein